MQLNRERNPHDDIRVTQDTGNLERRGLTLAALVHSVPISQVPVMEAAGNFSIRTSNSLASPDPITAPDILKSENTDTLLMDIDEGLTHAGDMSDNSSELSSARSEIDSAPPSLTRATSHPAVPVNSEPLIPQPTTLAPEQNSLSLPKEPLPTVKPCQEIRVLQTDPAVLPNDTEAKLTPQTVRAHSAPSPKVLSIREEMAKARVSRSSFSKQFSPQVSIDPVNRQALAPVSVALPGGSAKRYFQARRTSEPQIIQTPRKRRELANLLEGDVVSNVVSKKPGAEEVVRNSQICDCRTPRVPLSGMPDLREATGYSSQAEARPASGISPLKFKHMTSCSDADLAEFIQAIRSHASGADPEFMDCMKRYLTKKDVLRKLQDRSDYRHLILGPATASTIGLALHHALTHTLRILDGERGTARHLAGRVHKSRRRIFDKIS